MFQIWTGARYIGVCGYGQTVATNILFKRSTAVNETVTEVIRVV